VSGHTAVESTLRGFTRALARALLSERVAKEQGLLQRLDPRVRVLGMLGLVLSVTLCRRIEVVAALLGLAAIIGAGSRISLAMLVRRVWLVVLVFTALIALPALFVTPGDALLRVSWPSLTITRQGAHTAALLLLRVEAAATFTTVLVLSTSWTHILKALRTLHLPAEIVSMLAMTHRYAFLLIETANQMFESRQSRMVGTLKGADRRRMTARTAGVLLSKSVELSHEVYLAMISRGFRGEVQSLAEFHMRPRDYAGLAALVFCGAAAVWWGR
jgi:cobalt/nickel transport system permease protein